VRASRILPAPLARAGVALYARPPARAALRAPLLVAP